jgi:hypothetical protein
MSKLAKASRIENEPTVRLFEGERALVITGIFGFILSVGIAIYMFFRGSIILPEGNVKDAFSFNAAIGIYILSIAAILPLTRLNAFRRKAVRWLFILTSLYCYIIETVQNFRGISPRFSREGTVFDMAVGILFGVVSLVLVILAVVLTVHFFRLKKPSQRPLLIMGIRYAFISVLAANIAGLWMILLQDRLTGGTGNVIVLHGIGFHALQTLILPAWLLEKARVKESFKQRLIHVGGIAWLLMIVMIGIQTALGHSVFELTALPIIACLLFLIWFGTVVVACMMRIKNRKELTVTAEVLE